MSGFIELCPLEGLTVDPLDPLLPVGSTGTVALLQPCPFDAHARDIRWSYGLSMVL